MNGERFLYILYAVLFIASTSVAIYARVFDRSPRPRRHARR